MMVDDSRAVLIRDARLFDGLEVHRCSSVLVRGGRIVEIGDGIPAPADADVVDGQGRTLVPGLIDAHTHVSEGRLEQALAFGVTTELDMFADPRVVSDLRRRAGSEAGLADLRSAGVCATVPGGHPTGLVERGLYPPFPTITDAAEADEFVADRVAEGSDYVKIMIENGQVLGHPTPTLNAEAVHALVAAAHRHGKQAIVHAFDRQAVQLAVEAGADGLAHLPVDLPGHDLTSRIVSTGMFVISTLVIGESVAGQGHGPQTAADARFAPHLDQTSHLMLTMADGNFPLGPKARVDATAPATTVRDLHARGVTVLAGTDAGTLGVAHGASLHRELLLLVQAGLSPVQALTAATAAPAAQFGLSDRGRLAPGLTADLLLVDGDPTTDITAISQIHAIWRRGIRHR